MIDSVRQRAKAQTLSKEIQFINKDLNSFLQRLHFHFIDEKCGLSAVHEIREVAKCYRFGHSTLPHTRKLQMNLSKAVAKQTLK